MDARAVPVRKCSFAVFAVDQAAVLKITQGQPDRNTADVETAAKLVLARDGKRGWIIPAENLLCYCCD